MNCEIACKELEDELIATFILALDPGRSDSGAGHLVVPYHLGIAEEYILANLNRVVTREKLAETAGVSIPTLSRAFMKRYGTGPIGYLKQRRLDAAYRDLTGAKPGSYSVTEIALKYGFTHFGKFAIDYQKVFGESPSTSLSH